MSQMFIRALPYIYFCLFILCSCEDHQKPVEEKSDYYFSKVFGAYDAEMGYSIQHTSDNGYIISGATSSYWATDSLPRIFKTQHGVTDAIIAKLDSMGEAEWIYTYGGELFESAFNIQETNDGQYFFAGYTNSTGAGLYDIWIVKLDNNGTQIWEKTIGGQNSDLGLHSDLTADGGYIITGYTIPDGQTNKDFYLVKIDVNGNVEWEKTYGDSSNQTAKYIQETSDSGFIIAGDSWTATTNNDIYIIKTDLDGDMIWETKIIESNNDQVFSIKETNSGYILIGTTTSLGMGNKDIWVIKLNNQGSIEWNKTYGGEALEYGFDIIPHGNGYVFTGSTSSYGTEFYDIWVLKIDASGELIWDVIYGGPMIDIGRAIIENQSGGFTLLGQTSSYGSGEYDFWVLRLNEFGIVAISDSL